MDMLQKKRLIPKNKTAMSRFITTSVCLLLAFLLCPACDTVRISTLDNGRDSFAEAKSTWIPDESTFEEMVQKYGQPSDKVDIEGGFAARWLDRRTVTSTPPLYGNTNPVANFEAELNRPRNVMTITTALEAFYNKHGVLKDLRIQVLDQN